MDRKLSLTSVTITEKRGQLQTLADIPIGTFIRLTYRGSLVIIAGGNGLDNKYLVNIKTGIMTMYPPKAQEILVYIIKNVAITTSPADNPSFK